MAANFLGLIVLIPLVLLGGWLSFRSRRIKHPIFRWANIVLAGLVTLVLVLVAVVFGRGLYILSCP